MSYSLVSIIVPVYNTEKYLHKCIDSIINQTYKNLDIILIDDGSQDDCPRICDEYAKRDSRIRVLHKENGGLSDARNKGIDKARGDYVYFADSDDYLKPTLIEKCMNVINNYECEMVFFDVYTIKENEKAIVRTYSGNTVFSRDEIMRLILTDEIGSQVCFKFFKKSLLDGIRFPYGRTYEDIPTTYKIVYNCNIAVYISEPLYYYRLRQGSISFSVNKFNNYNIYLGLKERLEFSKINYIDIVDRCTALSCNFALGTYNALCADRQKITAQFEKIKEDILTHLKQNTKVILKNKYIKLRRKFMMYLLINNEKAYYLTYRLLNLNKI